MKLRFTNYRRPFEQPLTEPATRTQLESIVQSEGYDLEGAKAEWGTIELVDVVDDESGQALFQLYLYPGGSGCLYRHGTTECVGYVAQHGLEVEDPDLFDALQPAFEQADFLAEKVYFD